MAKIASCSHSYLQESLDYAACSVEKNVINHLRIDRSSISLLDLYNKIWDDIENLGFQIIGTNSLYDDTNGRSITSVILLYTSDTKDGGVIKLNNNCKMTEKFVALFHEYIHLRDDYISPKLPIIKSPNWQAVYFKPFIEHIEFQTKIMAYTLMMPKEKMWSDLISKSYNIDEILEIYKEIDICSVLEWVALIDRFQCHFAYVTYEKDPSGEIISYDIADSFFYDHQNNPVEMDFSRILRSSDSAAAKAVKNKTGENRKGEHKESTIDNINYYCYAYYESNFTKGTGFKNVPGVSIVEYDKLVVIGWQKQIYDFIQLFKLKP